jgi:branched-subunit amino acid transport protein AzlD
LFNFNDISYVGRLWCPEMIPDIEKFLPVAIFKMATTILHKFNIVRFQRPELIPDIEKFLPVAIFKMAVTIPQKFNIVRFQR